MLDKVVTMAVVVQPSMWLAKRERERAHLTQALETEHLGRNAWAKALPPTLGI